MVRRILAVTAVGVAAVALFYTATRAPSPPSPNAPESLSRPSLQRAGGVAGDEVARTSQFGAWAQRLSATSVSTCGPASTRASASDGLFSLKGIDEEGRLYAAV